MLQISCDLKKKKKSNLFHFSCFSYDNVEPSSLTRELLRIVLVDSCYCFQTALTITLNTYYMMS